MPKIRSARKTKAEQLAEDVARVVGAGRPVSVETVDFSDPQRPRTCLEVDFPILPVNQVAVIEGNAGKPIYQMSKWWARRRSSVFRALLLAAAMKAPDDPLEAAKGVWDVYYANHQKRGALKHLKVADIFMGGGTTVVEGARLGMQMTGVDLNPVAWFVVKTGLADVSRAEVEALLRDVEAEVKPQLMPFYACDGPNGEKGTWTDTRTGRVMGAEFNPFAIPPEERRHYRYSGPEMIYGFWAKHGPCQMTGCGHRTPIISSPVMAVKTLTVRAWPHTCIHCRSKYDIEDSVARMAPDVPLVVTEGQPAFATLDRRGGVVCPHCGEGESHPRLKDKPESKKVELALLIHPGWLEGEPPSRDKAQPLGGTASDDAESAARWNAARAAKMRLLEVRGSLPPEVVCPETGVQIRTGADGGTVPKKSTFTCGSCGREQDVLEAVRATGTTGPVAIYAIQGYSPKLAESSSAYGGRFFAPVVDPRSFDAAAAEWERRKDTDLAGYWPCSPVYPQEKGTDSKIYIQPAHGFTHWWKMFNPRQRLSLALLLKAIMTAGGENHRWGVREYALAAFQQYLRNQNMMAFWHRTKDHFAPAFSNNNYHPKDGAIEVGVYVPVGYGPWVSTASALVETAAWKENPWDLVTSDQVARASPSIGKALKSRSLKVLPGDSPRDATLMCASSTELDAIASGSYDLVITDPPFGDNFQYAELSDFFYVWLRLALRHRYPSIFDAEYTPKSLEVVESREKDAEDPAGFYKRLLTACWKEAFRVLKPGGLMAFTFHHSEDEPWVAVLESLFDAGFYLEATYPIRSDETKGEGEFGSKKIEYDIVHVCRTRLEEPQPVSWARMRRQVLQDVRDLKDMLEHHQREGLPAADLQVIRRGKALEYFSRHYGKVLVDEDRSITVKEALIGINQLLDEEAGSVAHPPPVMAEPLTRQFLRLFSGATSIKRDDMGKLLRGSGISPTDFVGRGWVREEDKVFHLVPPKEFAQSWHGKHRSKLASDYEQAIFLIGACHEGSGISAEGTLGNANFKPHPALGPLLEWFSVRGATPEARSAAARAATIFRTWQRKTQAPAQRQLTAFFEGAGDGA